MTPDALAHFASLARELALAARRETMPRFLEGCPADNKAGGEAYDPVTEADRSAEQAMREIISRKHPDHGISGEEFGDTPGQGSLSWCLDPVDGTRSFICGLPTWVTLAALLDSGEPVMGLIDAGFADNLLFSADTSRGYGKTVTVFLPKLKAAGANDEVLHRIMVDNSRRFLAFVPKRPRKR